MNESSPRTDLHEMFGFSLDEFQMEAIRIIDTDDSVVVSAPTGSGKTVVAEYGIMRSLSRGGRSFYTTPIKALSNQKFHDLVALFGRDKVGLLTGDNVLNPDAPIVVMTTEVLRNMLYARSPSLASLMVVILDEVHFIQDAYRGPVWEEVIIHLPMTVQLVCLSATVSNAPEVAEWMTTVRGRTRFVIESRRPVELETMVMIGDKSGEDHFLPILSGGGINPRLRRLLDSVPVRKGRGAPHRGRPLFTPRRSDVISRLRLEDLLPAIYFIFSRQGCDEAAASVARELPSLTTPAEKMRICEILTRHVEEMSEDDLDVLGFEGFKRRLEGGIASHHAGLVPPFKEAVEECFVEGLIHMVFATETLAVGINMPARSVVIEKLSKFTGEHHEFLSASQFTQLTGRAGRRGLDDSGHAVLLWSPFVTMEQMAGLAASTSFRLTSSFRPTYNMAVNLLRSYSREQARHLLNLSLAQFQSDRDVVKLEARVERKFGDLQKVEADLHGPYGSVDDYLALAEARSSPQKNPTSVGIEEFLGLVRPGQILHIVKGRYSGPGVVLASTKRARGWKVTVLSGRRSLLQITSEDFSEIPSILGRIDLPQPFQPTRQDFQKRALDRMSRVVRKGSSVHQRSEAEPEFEQPSPASQLPLSDPDLENKLRLARQVLRLRKEIPFLQEQVDRHTSSISRTFDKVLGILEEREYVANWELTSKGNVLARLFHESDLLIAETLHRGYLDGLDARELAALVSVFVYEHRSSEPPQAPWFPSRSFRSRWLDIEKLSAELRRVELANHLIAHRSPDPSYVSIALSWASGEDFAEVIETEELSGGDFVRTMKQLVDLLRQLALVAPHERTRSEALRASDMLMRGVVQASSTIGESV